MPPPADSSPHQRLADLGVGLFRPSPHVGRPSIDELAELIQELVASDDPRLLASLPCLFVLHDDVAPESVRRAARVLAADDVAVIGLCWRLARAFAIQWEPDILHTLGRRRRLPTLPIEPADLPDPEEQMGERCPAVARELYADAPSGNPVVDLIDTFRTWLRQTALERTPALRA